MCFSDRGCRLTRCRHHPFHQMGLCVCHISTRQLMSTELNYENKMLKVAWDKCVNVLYC